MSYGVLLIVGSLVLIGGLGFYLAYRKHRKKVRRAAAAQGEVLARLGRDAKDLTEPEEDAFTAMLREVTDPARQRGLLLAHLEPVIAEFVQDRTVKEFGIGETRILGTVGGCSVNALMQPAGYFSEFELSCGHDGFEVDLEYRSSKHDYLGEDEVREQLGHEVFLSARGERKLASQLKRWRKLSPELQERVVKAFRALETGRLRFGSDYVSLTELHLLDSDFGVARQRDPREKLRNVFLAAEAAICAVRSLDDGQSGSGEPSAKA